MGYSKKGQIAARRTPWRAALSVPAAFAAIAVLAGGGCDAATLEARTRKETSRALALLAGGGSQHPGTLAGALTGAAALDAFKTDAMPPDVFLRIGTNLRAADVRPVRRATYRQACEEGWAPKPTNDVQRAVWNRVHAIPDRPITIEYDPAKNR